MGLIDILQINLLRHLILPFAEERFQNLRAICRQYAEVITPLVWWRNKTADLGVVTKWQGVDFEPPATVRMVRFKQPPGFGGFWWASGVYPTSVLYMYNVEIERIVIGMTDGFAGSIYYDNYVDVQRNTLELTDKELQTILGTNPVFPPHLLHLKCGPKFDVALIPAFLPASLVHLSVASNYPYPLHHLVRKGLSIYHGNQLIC